MGTYFGALDAFFPGELALSGDLRRAARLEDSCCRIHAPPKTVDLSKAVFNTEAPRCKGPGRTTEAHVCVFSPRVLRR